MNTQKLLEHKPNFELEAMLEQISKSKAEVMPLKFVDYYPTNFVLIPSDVSDKQFNTFMNHLRNIGYTLQNPHTVSVTK